jgi:hypothetical protein
MLRFGKNLPKPNLHDWVEDLSHSMAEGLTGLPANPAMTSHIGELSAQAMEGKVKSFETMLSYISAAHGLHQASENAKAAGNAEWADELHRLGQLFLHHAVSDVEALFDVTLPKCWPSQVLATTADGSSIH